MRSVQIIMFCFCGLSSCIAKKENTYEENFALCTKNRAAISEDTNAELKSELKSYECMKGSKSPVFMIKTDHGDSIITKPSHGKAMVLYFWYIAKSNPPFGQTDIEDMEALNSLYHSFSEHVDFIGFPFNEFFTAKRYACKHQLDFPQAQGEATAEKEFKITQGNNPFIIFINTKGQIVKIFAGSYARKNKIIEKYTPIIQACINNNAYIE